MLLESYESARKRGADILAEVIGFSCNNNGGDLILPNRNGITQTIKLGLKDADVSPDAVDFISAHATATKHGRCHRSPGNRQRIWQITRGFRPEKLYRPHHGVLRGDRIDHDPLYDAGRLYRCRP